jgi:hypothetical protein
VDIEMPLPFGTFLPRPHFHKMAPIRRDLRPPGRFDPKWSQILIFARVCCLIEEQLRKENFP